MSNSLPRKWPARSRLTIGIGTTVAAVMLVIASVPVAAQPSGPGVSTCPVLNIANPAPGDRVSSGDYVVSGIAFDPAGVGASSVSRVDFFLGPRDLGGQIVGSLVPDPAAPNPRQMFSTTITLPDVNRGDTFVAYAYSSLTGATTSVALPIEIGNETQTATSSNASPTPVPSSVTVKSGCPELAVSQPGGVGVPVVSLTAVATPVVAITPSEGPTLRLANPNANDVLPHGTYIVIGAAFDPNHTGDSPGVDRVEFFLGDRDAGGIHLGTGTPGTGGMGLGGFAARLWIPVNANGGNSFVAYAQSSMTSAESVLSIPVFVGTTPSPTPRP